MRSMPDRARYETPADIVEVEAFQPHDRREWRDWLERNHATSQGVGLVYFKRGSGRRNITLDEAILEALAFGWIDGRMNRLDDDRVMLRFTPRRKGSTWAATNKNRVERLLEEGLMTSAGMAKVEEAKRDGSWYLLDDVEDMIVPEDLASALGSHPPARRLFDECSRSQRKQLLGWLKGAKKATTRQRRIEAIVGVVLDKRKAADVLEYMAPRS